MYENLAEIFAAAIGVLIVLLIICLAVMVFILIGQWKMYKKAGKNGWEAIIPFYNNYVLVQIAGLQWYWFLIPLIAGFVSGMGIPVISGVAGLASIVASANVAYNMSKKFNKSTAWFVVSIFFSGLTYALLGYSSNEKYDESAATTPNGFVDGIINKNNSSDK